MGKTSPRFLQTLGLWCGRTRAPKFWADVAAYGPVDTCEPGTVLIFKGCALRGVRSKLRPMLDAEATCSPRTAGPELGEWCWVDQEQVWAMRTG